MYIRVSLSRHRHTTCTARRELLSASGCAPWCSRACPGSHSRGAELVADKSPASPASGAGAQLAVVKLQHTVGRVEGQLVVSGDEAGGAAGGQTGAANMTASARSRSWWAMGSSASNNRVSRWRRAPPRHAAARPTRSPTDGGRRAGDRELSHQRERVVARPRTLPRRPGSVTFSATVSSSNSQSDWGTTATSLHPGPRGPPSAPATTTDPASGRSQPVTMGVPEKVGKMAWGQSASRVERDR
jgi:hypothetical protein